VTCTGFDRKAEYRAQLDHLIALAKTPGWKRYAWARAQELEAERSGLYAGIAAALTAAMTGQAAPSACESPSPERPH
jgi:hypothetical protein